MNGAVKRAMTVVSERAERENVQLTPRDMESISWELAGIQAREGDSAALRYAENTPFARKKRTIRLGYATAVEEASC